MTDQLNAIVSKFAIEGDVDTVEPCGNGLINSTYLVHTKQSDTHDYILQRINHNIFTDVDLLQNNLLNITDHIRKRLLQEGKDTSRHTLTLIPTKEGKLYHKEDDEYWRMTILIPDSFTPEKTTPEMAYLTGLAFGEFHGYFTGNDVPQIRESIPDFHNVAFRIEQLKEAADKNPASRLDEVREIVDELLSRQEEMTLANRLNKEGKLPKRITHCDTKVNNILFDSNNQPLCVIDLDTTMPGYVLSDFGDFMRTAGNKGLEDDPNLDNVEIDMIIFRNFARGYIESGSTFLTDIELDLLPFGAQMLTYMQTVRFLTDYLNGDTYYKIQYPKHNLVRTKAQLKLLHSIDNHIGEMNKFIKGITNKN